MTNNMKLLHHIAKLRIFLETTKKVEKNVAKLFSQKTKIPLHVDGARRGGSIVYLSS